ncbi:TM2 domain-containing protein [Litoribacter ruber]|uniref:TM2 domain-containing protein n=1 Tax=Litoribacter ruber TaxID=702568 RepID=UPI001BD9F81C|nr:TM2 domain-containing protein [Litoribacter ruber]MBT0813123.1 TM2 domain-containing protein [Litoribacter ruber]
MEKFLSAQTHLSADVRKYLTPALMEELSLLPSNKKMEFLELYLAQAKSLTWAYLALVLVFPFHYAYQDRWGKQVLFWVTAGGLFVWWAVDFFRIPGMIREYNENLGFRILERLEREV